MPGVKPFSSDHRDLWVVDLLKVLSDASDLSDLDQSINLCIALADGSEHSRPVDCRPGCPYCCVLNVAILLPEAAVIANWLSTQLTKTARDNLSRRLSDYCKKVRWVSDEERIVKRLACPFLDEVGSCTIYTVRPLVCRGVASFDRIRCLEAFDTEITDRPRLVPVDFDRQAAYDKAFLALAQAIELCGMDSRSIELGQGVLAFLEDPTLKALLFGDGCLPNRLWET